MRLLILLVFLATGLWISAVSLGSDSAPARQGLARPDAAPEAKPLRDLAPLPATVARLVRQSEGAQTPTPISDQRGPIILPLPTLVTRADPSVPVIAASAVLPLTADAVLRLQRVTANSANVRQGPSTGNPVIARVTRDEEVAVLETANGWSRIRIEGDGVEGWVSSKLLTD